MNRTSLVSILLVAGILGLAGFGIAGRLQQAPELMITEVSGERVSGELQIAGVSRLVVDGSWEIRVLATDSAGRGPIVELPESGVRYRIDDDTLELDTVGVGRREAVLVLSRLEAVEIDGASDITLVGFESDRLRIEVDGAGRLVAQELQIENLELSTDGAAQVDFASARITNATVDVDGAASIALGMAGGGLEGRMDGAAILTYSGEVASENVRVNGLGAVRRSGDQ